MCTQTLRSIIMVFLSQNVAHTILEIISEGEDPMSLVGCEFGLKFPFTLKTVTLLLDFPPKSCCCVPQIELWEAESVYRSCDSVG